MSEGDERCPSCEHTWRFHHFDGCWYTVTHGRQDTNSVCPCRLMRPEQRSEQEADQ